MGIKNPFAKIFSRKKSKKEGNPLPQEEEQNDILADENLNEDELSLIKEKGGGDVQLDTSAFPNEEEDEISSLEDLEDGESPGDLLGEEKDDEGEGDKKDSLLDIFKEEEEEEVTSQTLMENLEDIGTRDVLSECQEVAAELRKAKAR